MSNARWLVVNEQMPIRATPAEVVAMLDADVRDAAAKAKAKLTAMSERYTVTGYKIDDNEWQMGVTGRTVTVAMRLVRPD